MVEELESKTTKEKIKGKVVTVVIAPLTKREARQIFPYRPKDKYSESRFGGNNLTDDISLLIGGDAIQCNLCAAITRREYLIEGICPDCDGRSEYNGKNPHTN